VLWKEGTFEILEFSHNGKVGRKMPERKQAEAAATPALVLCSGSFGKASR
jgi:hypothetical protein